MDQKRLISSFGLAAAAAILASPAVYTIRAEPEPEPRRFMLHAFSPPPKRGGRPADPVKSAARKRQRAARRKNR